MVGESGENSLFLHLKCMCMFIGEYICKLDNKGRVLFPAALKRQMSGSGQSAFVVKKDVFENCLVLYPMEEWQRQNELLRRQLNPYNREHNRFLRQFYKGAAELSLDSNNRILIPRRLLDGIDAQKELTFAGQDSRVEIWARETWSHLERDDDFGALAEKLLGGTQNYSEDV